MNPPWVTDTLMFGVTCIYQNQCRFLSSRKIMTRKKTQKEPDMFDVCKICQDNHHRQKRKSGEARICHSSKTLPLLLRWDLPVAFPHESFYACRHYLIVRPFQGVSAVTMHTHSFSICCTLINQKAILQYPHPLNPLPTLDSRPYNCYNNHKE